VISLQDLRELPEAKRLAKLAAATACLWLVGLVLLFCASSASDEKRARLADCDGVLYAGGVVKSYPAQSAASGQEPVAAVASITDSLGLKERVAQMNSGPAGLTLQISSLYPEELTKFVEALSSAGLSVRTAEVRAMSSGGDKGRLINVTLALEGERR
jgi:hypothetical protein